MSLPSPHSLSRKSPNGISGARRLSPQRRAPERALRRTYLDSLRVEVMSVAIVLVEFCCYERGWLGLSLALDHDPLFLLEGYWG